MVCVCVCVCVRARACICVTQSNSKYLIAYFLKIWNTYLIVSKAVSRDLRYKIKVNSDEENKVSACC
jgi:hypothetical protein